MQHDQRDLGTDVGAVHDSGNLTAILQPRGLPVMAGTFRGLLGPPGSGNQLCGRSEPNRAAFGVPLGSGLALCVFVGPRRCPELSSVAP